MTMRLTGICLVILVVLTGCAGAGNETVESRVPEDSVAVGMVGDLPFGVSRCWDVRLISADESQYRDEPVYTGDDWPTARVLAWAQSKPGFEEMWIDGLHNNWVTVAFSQDADLRQAELAERFPGEGVVVIAVEWGQDRLGKLRDDAVAAAQASEFEVRGSTVVSRARVELWADLLSDELLSALAPFAGPQLCVHGILPDDVIPEGPQPTEGDGWRLLATQATGPIAWTGAATSPAQYERVWRLSEVDGEAAKVDFDTEIVVWFAVVHGGDCPVRLDDIVFDWTDRVVHGVIVTPGIHHSCQDDANPRAFLIALDRDQLPPTPFAIRQDAEGPPDYAPRQQIEIETDLRTPGATIASSHPAFDQPPTS